MFTCQVDGMCLPTRTLSACNALLCSKPHENAYRHIWYRDRQDSADVVSFKWLRCSIFKEVFDVCWCGRTGIRRKAVHHRLDVLCRLHMGDLLLQRVEQRHSLGEYTPQL